jgi:hypothetical protein
MENAKKALHDSDSRSRSESLNDSGIYIYILKAFISSSVMHLRQGLQKHTVSLKCN